MTKRKIMIVDDEAGITRMIKLALEQTGCYEVFEENKSTRALDATRVYNPDLVILDVTMPELNGTDLARLMQADPKLCYIPIVFLTATITREESRGEDWRENVMYIRKPATLPELINAIEQSIEIASKAKFERVEEIDPTTAAQSLMSELAKEKVWVSGSL